MCITVFAVRDLSKTSVSISPAEYGSWADARSEMITEAKRPIKAQKESELATAANQEEIDSIRSHYNKKETELEHEIDHKPMDLHMSLSVAYNFLSK